MQIFKIPCVAQLVNFDSSVKLLLFSTHSASVSHGKTQYIDALDAPDVFRHAPPHLHALECSHVPPFGVHFSPPPLDDDELDDAEDELAPEPTRHAGTVS